MLDSSTKTPPIRIASLLAFLTFGWFCPAQAQTRVVSLSSPQTETLYALGAQANVVGVSDVCVFPEQVVQDRRSGRIREMGAFAKPDVALIDQIHPDPILTGTAFQRNVAAALRAKGYR